MQQATLVFEDPQVRSPTRLLLSEQERQLVELMTQAINAVRARRAGEEDESAAE